jgi:iron complex transport system ATP-binding protein
MSAGRWPGRCGEYTPRKGAVAREGFIGIAWAAPPESARRAKEAMEHAIRIQGATVMRGGAEVLKDVSLNVGADERLCLLGPNGSGKSSLIQLISGDLHPLAREGSSVSLFGEENWNLFELRSRIGIVSGELERRQRRDESVLDTILSGFYGGVGIPLRTEPEAAYVEAAQEAASRMGLTGLLERRVTSLSSGQCRRVLIARALAHRPELLLLDEPYDSLDYGARRELSERIEELAHSGTGLIMVTHDLRDIPRAAGRLVLLREGRIMADGPLESSLNSASLSATFGLGLELSGSRESGYSVRYL